MEYILEQLRVLTAINSPSGYTDEVCEYVINELKNLGYAPARTNKGGILCEIGGEDRENALVLTAHIDTLGGMVSAIKANGRLKISPVGGLNANNAECENCTIITRFNDSYSGTLQMNSPSVHVNKDYSTQKREFADMEVVIDELTASKEETEKLGIAVGDYVCFDPRTVITKSGYIKSRFLDDKLSVAILLGLAKEIRGKKLPRVVYFHITVFEEVGHGGCGSIPAGVTEILGVDMGCVGDDLECDERKVSICAKDSAGPSNYDMVTRLIRMCRDNGLDYAVDVYPYYGSDADSALSAGHDIRHALIGAGVYASHGYERSHVDGVKNTLELLKAFIKE